MSLRAEVAEVQRRTQAGVEQRVDVVLWTEGRAGAIRVEHEVTVPAVGVGPDAADAPIAAESTAGEALAARAEDVRHALDLLGIPLEDRPESSA